MGQAKARKQEITALKEQCGPLKKELGQVFTPYPLVKEILDKIPTFVEPVKQAMWKTYIDPACGNGRFLMGVVRKLMDQYANDIGENKVFADNTAALDHIFQYQLFGVDLDQVQVTAATANLKQLAEAYGYSHSETMNFNVVCANALTCNMYAVFTENMKSWKRPYFIKTLEMFEMTTATKCAPGMLVLCEEMCKPDDMIGLDRAMNKFAIRANSFNMVA